MIAITFIRYIKLFQSNERPVVSFFHLNHDVHRSKTKDDIFVSMYLLDYSVEFKTMIEYPMKRSRNALELCDTFIS